MYVDKIRAYSYDSLNSSLLFYRLKRRSGGTTTLALRLGMNLCKYRRDNSQFPNPTANLVSVFGERALIHGLSLCVAAYPTENPLYFRGFLYAANKKFRHVLGHTPHTIVTIVRIF